MPEPYYSDDWVTLYNADCREETAWLAADVLVTDPPYPNNAGWFLDGIECARSVVSDPRWVESIVFWSELEHPPAAPPLVAVHIWHRSNVNGRPYEPAYHFAQDGRKRRSDVLRHPAVFPGVGPGCNEYAGHPTQKPEALMRRLVSKTAAGVVADPFAGVGATLLAARSLGRKAVGVEIEERYCEVAARRLSQGVLDFGALGA